MALIQGTIHTLRKQFYSTKLILTSNFFTKTRFFVKTKEFFFQHYVHFGEIFNLTFLVRKEKEKLGIVIKTKDFFSTLHFCPIEPNI